MLGELGTARPRRDQSSYKILLQSFFRCVMFIQRVFLSLEEFVTGCLRMRSKQFRLMMRARATIGDVNEIAQQIDGRVRLSVQHADPDAGLEVLIDVDAEREAKVLELLHRDERISVVEAREG